MKKFNITLIFFAFIATSAFASTTSSSIDGEGKVLTACEGEYDDEAITPLDESSSIQLLEEDLEESTIVELKESTAIYTEGLEDSETVEFK